MAPTFPFWTLEIMFQRLKVGVSETAILIQIIQRISKKSLVVFRGTLGKLAGTLNTDSLTKKLSEKFQDGNYKLLPLKMFYDI